MAGGGDEWWITSTLRVGVFFGGWGGVEGRGGIKEYITRARALKSDWMRGKKTTKEKRESEGWCRDTKGKSYDLFKVVPHEIHYLFFFRPLL